MENKEAKELKQIVLDINNNVKANLEEAEELENIVYYKDFEFEQAGILEKDLFVVKINNKEDNTSEYQIFDKEQNLVAIADNKGRLQFTPEYIENLRNIDENYFLTLNLDDIENFEIPEKLEREDRYFSKDELEDLEAEKRVEDVKEFMGDDEIKSYTEADTNKEIVFDKITNKQELDPYEKVTGTENLADMIPEIKEKGYVKIGVVYSNASKGQSGMFSFVGITADGQIGTIDSLENLEGTTTGQTITSINSRDGSVVQEEQVQGMLQIEGRNSMNGTEEYLSVKIGQYGIIEVDYVRAELSMDEEKRYISAPIETRSQMPTSKEVKDFMDRSRNIDMEDELKKAEPEIERDGETRIENIDETASNDKFGPDDIIVLEDGNETTLRKEAEKAKVSVEEFMKKYEERSGKTPDEKLEEIHEEIEEEYGAPSRTR